MTFPSRARKALTIAARPAFLRAFTQYRVAAATEHLRAIRYSRAGTLIDAGANKGQFSLAFRKLQPTGEIIAFEPLPEAADVFERLFRYDDHCVLHRLALAQDEGSARFHIANRSDSSSLLKPGMGQQRAFGVRPAQEITVDVRRLDNCVNLNNLVRPTLLKVDIQGGELSLFEGCDTLEQLDYIYVELSYVELYEEQPLFHDVSEYLSARGFSIAGIYNQVETSEFGPTQVDVLFRRVDGTQV